jgi:mRNA-degrading endonuclease YafQ of YafQ-DinJ toxin-antitoxin module
MIIKYSSNFCKRFEKLKKSNPGIKSHIDKKLKLLAVNPRYPGLRLHKIESQENSWSISVDLDLRILFVYRDYGILLVDIGTHDEVY